MGPHHAVWRRIDHHHVPKAFPKQCYNVQATVIASPNSSLAYTVQVEAVTKTNCLINGNRTDGTAVTAPQMDVYWMAIGH
jgi:hypothetical protein